MDKIKAVFAGAWALASEGYWVIIDQIERHPEVAFWVAVALWVALAVLAVR